MSVIGHPHQTLTRISEELGLRAHSFENLNRKIWSSQSRPKTSEMPGKPPLTVIYLPNQIIWVLIIFIILINFTSHYHQDHLRPMSITSISYQYQPLQPEQCLQTYLPARAHIMIFDQYRINFIPLTIISKS